MALLSSSQKLFEYAYDRFFAERHSYYHNGKLQGHLIKCEGSFARAVATRAWFQVVDSIISDYPPIGMSAEYYRSRPESGSDYLQEQLKHLEIYRYKLGTESIQAKLRSEIIEREVIENDIRSLWEEYEASTKFATYSNVVQADEIEDQPGIEDIQYPVSAAADEVEDRQGIEDIQYPMKSAVRTAPDEVENWQGIEDIQYPMKSAVRTAPDEVEDWQGIEDIQYPVKSTVRTAPDEVEDQPVIEDIQYPVKSVVRTDVVQADNVEYQQGIENIQPNEDEDRREIEKIQSPVITAVRVDLDIIKHLIIYGVHYEVVPANKGENEVTTIPLENIQAKGLSVLYELLELVKNGDQGRTQQSTLRSEVLELIEELHDKGIYFTRMVLEKVLLHLKYGDIEKDTPVQYIKKYIELILKLCNMESCQRTLCRMSSKAEGNHCRHCKEMQENEEISTLFDELLELVENGGHVHEGEKPNLRFKVLKLIKVLHHYGVDTIQSAVKEELEGVNQEYAIVEKDSTIGYKKKALEVMLRICDILTCQKTLYELISTTESDQVLYT